MGTMESCPHEYRILIRQTLLFFSPEQHWSLMPLHSVLSSVRPASFLYGNGGGYGGPNAMTFPQYVTNQVDVKLLPT